MGGIKRDANRYEYEFKNISFSDVETIKGLIIHRKYIDPYKDIYTNNHIEQAGFVSDINQEIICLFADLDDLIKHADLTEKQRYIIDALMNGKDFVEVADDFGQYPWRIGEILNTACKKIKELNDYRWKYDYIYMNYKKVEWGYKKCSKCNEYKPMTEEFFSPDKRNNDRLHSICKKCR